LASALLFDEKIRKSSALFWFGLRDVGILCSEAVIQRTIYVSQNFELLSNIQDQKIKNKKPIAVDILFKAYPMIPLSCRSNLAGRYL
jgi:hypothetical protein